MVINGVKLIMEQPIKDMIGFKVHEHGVSRGLGEAGYDICIKQEIQFVSKSWSENYVMSQEKDELGRVKHFRRKPGKFIIASAIEEFDMPTNMIGIVHDKSTWARQGLSVFNTVIECGWKGFLTLELVYHGTGGLIIPAGAAIAQVVFHQTYEHQQYAGKYQGQADEPVSAIASV
jgi:dCTP deaminase